jgi:hypothetical protein
MSATYANVSNQIAALKELYTGDDYMKDLVYEKPVHGFGPER